MEERVCADRNSTKPNQPGPFEPTRETEEEEVPPHTEYESPPGRVAKLVTTRREIPVGDVVERIIEELKEEHD